MNTHAGKTQENKSQAVAHNVSKRKGNDSAFAFADNRAETIAQRKLQEHLNNSSGKKPVASNALVLQAKWIRDRSGKFYWDGDGGPDTPCPGEEMPAPDFQALEDVHAARRGGSMISLRTRPNYDGENMDMLAHFASQASEKRGVYYDGAVEKRGLGPLPVSASVSRRDPGEHRSIFSKMTGGESSSTRYQQDLGTALPGTNYQILHGFGFGEGGQQTQDPRNLSSASEGANSEMIPFDKKTAGNPDVINNTFARVRPGTHRAESMHMSFAHASFPETPFFERDVDGDLPKPTRSQYEAWEAQAPEIPADPAHFFMAAALHNMAKQPMEDEDE